MGYLIANGHLYVSLECGSKITYTVYFQQAYIFKSFKRASNFVRDHSLQGFYVVDSEKRDRVTTADSKKAEETKSKRRKFNDTEKKIVYAKTKGRCALCGRFMNYDEFTVDHILPISKGGTNNMDNLQATCLVCNRIKQDILPQDFMDKIGEIFIHNMRVSYRKDLIGKVVRLYKVHHRKSLIDFIKKI